MFFEYKAGNTEKILVLLLCFTKYNVPTSFLIKSRNVINSSLDKKLGMSYILMPKIIKNQQLFTFIHTDINLKRDK